MSSSSTSVAEVNSPIINLIPPELLCRIFALGVPVQSATSPPVNVLHRVGSRSHTTRDYRSEWRKPSIFGAPWVFGHVCTHWRSIAISLPELWSSITLCTTIDERELPLLETQLGRTGKTPLDVLIRFTCRVRAVSFDDFLFTLVSHRARWRTLHLEFNNEGNWPPPSAFAALTLNNNPNSNSLFPLLEELVFSGENLTLTSQPAKYYDFFQNAPALRRVVLSSVGVMSIRRTPPPWNLLTTYKATYSDAIIHLRNLTASAANLVVCDIGFGWRGPADLMELHDGLTLPRLRRLAVSHPEFLTCLTAPALKSLYITGPRVDPVLPFLRRSGCTETLAELTFAVCTVPAPEIIALLRCTRGLTAFALDLRVHGDSPHAPEEVVAALVASEAQCLCPNLASLSYADLEDMLDRDAFADMVLSRCVSAVEGVRRLYSITVYSGRRRMKRAGWRLRVVPELEVSFLNAKKGRPALKGWRDY